MASNKEKKLKEEQEEERKIPVFTVLKNGVILKNIFVINNPPSPSTELSISGLKSITAVENEENPDQETEETLIVGRHPDCNVVLMHPSISRFHLQINSKPSSQKLFVTDLSSVHGTWVSERKIEPGFRVGLNEGDTIRVGGSTRLYRLHWVPLSHAYDMESRFVSVSDMAMIEEKEEENKMLEEENEMKISQDENLLATEIKHVEEQASLLAIGKEEEKYQFSGAVQYVNSISAGNEEILSLDLILEDLASLFSDENCGLSVKKELPSAPVKPENIVSSFYDANGEIESPSRNNHEVGEILSIRPVGEVILETKSQQFNEHNQSPESHSIKEATERQSTKSPVIRSEQESNVMVNLESSLSVTEVEAHLATVIREETENPNLLRKDFEQMDIFPSGIESVNVSLPVGDLSETNSEQFDKENQTSAPLVTLQPVYKEENQKNSTENQNLNVLVSLNSACSDDVHDATEILDEAENQSLSRIDYGQSDFASVCSVPHAAESVNSSLPTGKILSDIMDSKESQTPQSVFAAIENLENLKSSRVRSEKKPSSHNIWSRRGKPDSALQLRTIRCRRKTRGVDIDAEVEWENQEDVEDRSITKAPFSYIKYQGEMEEEEIFTPDKENYTPNTLLLLKSLKKKSKIEEIQISNSCKSSSSKFNFSPNIQPEEDMFASSDKENETPKVFQQRKSAKPFSKNQVKLEQEMVLKERKAERVPLQSVFVDFSGSSISEASVPSHLTGSTNSVNCTQTMQKKVRSPSISTVGDGKTRWTMVADTTSLLDKKSRKSLQLLQGLKGTHLIIPKMVIRELDCLKRRGSLFRRTTEASLVLEWIEECMVKTKWWIHVQSSVEEERPLAPTPPVSPRTRFNEGSDGFACGTTTSSVPFSACGSLLEIVSPTAEDHILDCALFYRKMNHDGQLVLLSNDVTLTIKAMAEGLICETAQEFRESLVNPFSERFLWADSSPRGLTWSVLDDLVLKEKYYPSPSKKSLKGEGAKGLKLILLHNSHYGRISQSVKTT